MKPIQLVECPRDAWQGIHDFIPTDRKISHLKRLLNVGFEAIDAGSFVSPKAMPQMADAEELFAALEEHKYRAGATFIAIIANLRGAQRAASFDSIDQWGYPLSVSATFQQKNSNKTIDASLEELKRIKELADQKGKKLIVYLSMAFGNPFGDDYSYQLVEDRLAQALSVGADIISLSDTTGQGSLEQIQDLSERMVKSCPTTWGMHLHSEYEKASEKVRVAIESGCYRLDTALKGFGGCPFASDELIGNMPTEQVLSNLSSMRMQHNIDPLALESAYNSAMKIFGQYS
jgi:hydroxymethylglutaryl-CoA lyase